MIKKPFKEGKSMVIDTKEVTDDSKITTAADSGV